MGHSFLEGGNIDDNKKQSGVLLDLSADRWGKAIEMGQRKEKGADQDLFRKKSASFSRCYLPKDAPFLDS